MVATAKQKEVMPKNRNMPDSTRMIAPDGVQRIDCPSAQASPDFSSRINLQPIRIEKGSFQAYAAARAVLVAMRGEGVFDISEVQGMAWTGLPQESVRAGFVFLAADSGVRLYTSQSRLMLSFGRLPRISVYFLPPWVLKVWVRMRGVMHALWPLMALALTATALCGLSATYLAVIIEVFPNGAKIATGLAALCLGIVVLFVMPAITLLFALGLPVLAVVAIFYGEWRAGFALVPVTAVVWFGLPFMWSIGKRLTERAWNHVRFLFNFGRDTGDALENERLFVQLTRARGGRVVLADLCVLHGWNIKKSFAEMQRLLVEHGGEVLVDDYGRIWFDFPTLCDGVPLAPNPIWKREREPRLVFDERARRLDIAMVVLVVAGVVPYVYLTLQKYEGTRRAAEYVWRGWGSGPRAALILAIYTIFFVVILILTRRVLVGWRQKKWMNRMHWFELLRAATRGQVRVNQSDLDAGFVKSLKGEVSAKEGENLVLEFSEFRQLDFAEDVWGRMPRRADLT